MRASEFLSELLRQGVRFWADGDQLRYRAPKGALTPSLFTMLAEYKAEILALLSRHRNAEHAALLPRPVPAPEQRYLPFPLTDVQLAYWVGRSAAFELGNVGDHGYIEVEAYELNLARCELAMQLLIERHEMLRAIILPDGQQRILEHVPPFQLKMVDLREIGPQARAAQLEHIRHSMDHQLLPVEQWPSFDMRVSRLDDQRVRLHLSVEFLFMDAWSVRILIQEFTRLYHQPDAVLPSLELSFRDYLLAQETLHDSELYQRSQEYWVERLPLLPPAPDLPLAQSPSSLDQPRFVDHEARLNVESWQRLKARAARAGLTPTGVLLAAFAEVLTTWSKSARFSINLSFFNRLPLHPQVNSVVGDFTSLIVLAVDNSIPDSFENRARRLQEQLWSDLDHGYYSGVRVLRELARTQTGMGKAVMPIVFTSLLVQDTANTASKYPSPWQETIYCVSQTPQVWLDYQVLEVGGSLAFHWLAADALFPEGLLDDMLDAYCRLLQRLATGEEAWQETVRQLVPEEQLEQRVQNNATDAPVSDRLLHTLFTAQVPQRPQQAAVISPARVVTYAELYSGSTQLAQQLRQLEVQPNQLVAVVMEKGWEQVLAVLGVLQSGAAYLPIEPALPHERLRYLLAHGEVEIIVTQSWLDQQIAWPEHLHRLCVDSLDLKKVDVPALESVQGAEDLAYVIYTSGSTGLPKGVMIDHRGAVNTILDINERFAVSSQDRVLALSSLNFDLSVYDIFGLLAAGGTIVMPAEGTMRDPAAWLEMLLREQVTLWNSVPALMQMLIEFVKVQSNALTDSCLRLALLSGDWIPLPLPDQLKDLLAGIEVISLGGATEASIWSILFPIEAIEPSWNSIPYGRPMRNQRFHVLNETLDPCPVWVPGQLYIGGVGLAKGYWRDEEKTQACFLTHPHTGERLYRTGDLGRYLPGGSIEFLGREDFQVKVQGHRIELGEIEETLLQHPEVRAAVATAITKPHGDKRLVAYVVLGPEAGSNGEHISQPLPIKNYTPQQDALQHLELQFGQSGIRKDMGKPVIELAYAVSDANVIEKYRRRLSYRTFRHEPISFRQFSDFLGALRQVELEGLPKYLYPSAGGIYPVQTYLYIKPDRVEGFSEGIYYYNPRSHQLVGISDNERLDRSCHRTHNRPVFDESAFSLFFIGQLSVISSMYGELSRDFCMVEAGYMSQLLMTAAPMHHIGFCPVGEVDYPSIRDLFSLEESHVFLHSLLCGRVDPTLATGWSFLSENSGETTPLWSVQPQAPRTTAVTVAALDSFLKEKLPKYMIPSTITVLDSLPLTANGKVDRKNLPAPEITSNKLVETYVAPKSEMEQTIAAVWQEMLPVEKVGIHDNFFDLSGNSLLMVQTYTKLREILGRDISLVEMFFQYATIHSLAEFLTQGQHTQSALEESLDQRYDRIESHKESMQEQRQARLKHRAAERSEDE